MLLAGCFFLPLIAPSRTSIACICWHELVSACRDSPLPTDAIVFLVLGLVMPYLIGLLLAMASLARLLADGRVARACRFSLRALLVLVGVGVLWSLPNLYYENMIGERAGLFSSGLALAALLLWPLRSARSRQSLWTGLALSLGCLFWFSYLLFTIPVEAGGTIGAACGAVLLAAHGFEVWPIRLAAAPAKRVELAPESTVVGIA